MSSGEGVKSANVVLIASPVLWRFGIAGRLYAGIKAEVVAAKTNTALVTNDVDCFITAARQKSAYTGNCKPHAMDQP